MPQFSERSKQRLDTCHPDLQRLFNEVVKHYECSILIGHRGQDAQNMAFKEGKSKQQWPDSKHNKLPSLAVDAAPYPIDWDDIHGFYHFAGFVLGIAESLGIKVRWGGNWAGGLNLKPQKFNDLPHFELVDTAPIIVPT